MPKQKEKKSVQPSRDSTPWLWTALSILLLAAAALLTWSNTFHSPFLFDDGPAIEKNEALHTFWPPWRSAWAPSDTTLGGRPVPTLTFVLNYALHGLSLPGYHAVNLLLHVLASITLFGVLRRTFNLPSLRDRFASVASPLALTIALLWLLHPLTTQSVTYIVRRVEVMLGLFFFLTLYAAIRTIETHQWRWRLTAMIACLLGMATSETMVVAPLVILLYDRAFVASSFRDALSSRRRLYALLSATWLPLILLQLHNPRGSGAGFHLGFPVVLDYLQLQGHFILRYVLLAFRPVGLIFDYGMLGPGQMTGSLLEVIIVAALVIATAVLLFIRPRWAFLPAAFFLVLAPSSSVIPITVEVAAENRMYIPLAALVTGVTLLAFLALRRLTRQLSRGRRSFAAEVALPVLLALAAVGALAALTYTRNADYRDPLTLWNDTVAKRPDNPRVLYSLADALTAAHRLTDALPWYRKAAAVSPRDSAVWLNWGNALIAAQRVDEAEQVYRTGLRANPDAPVLLGELGMTLMRQGKPDEAADCFSRVIQAQPDNARAHYGLAVILRQRGNTAEAIAHYRQTIQLDPSLVEALNGLAWVLATHSDPQFRNGAEAVQLARKACELTGDKDYLILNTLAVAYAEAGQYGEAIRTGERAHALAIAAGAFEHASQIDEYIKRFKAHQPCHEPYGS